MTIPRSQRPFLRLLNLLLILLLTAIPECAFADWINPGIAYRCDQTKGVFEMMATMATSSPETAGEVRVPSGYVPLSKENDDPVLFCQIGVGGVKAFINIIRAREHGMCSAFDYLQITRLQINEKILFEYEQFSSGCHFDPVLHHVELRVRGKALSVKTCRAAWMWDTGYSPETCEERMVSIPQTVKRKIQ